ncbi:hypothetical protein F3G12_19025, partial [Acinetobacter baumannii]
MIRYSSKPVMISGGQPKEIDCVKNEQREKTLAYSILRRHDTGAGDRMKIRFDAMASHDITYVGVI